MRHIYKTIFFLFLSVTIASAQASKGGLKVFIENAVTDEIIGATVQVMDGERQVTGGVTDFNGFVYLPNIEAGTYTVIIRHINIGEAKFQVTIKSNSIYELRQNIAVGTVIDEVIIKADNILDEGGGDTKTTEDILRLPARGVNGIVALSAGVTSVDGGAPVIRGGRGDQVITYIDGIPVRGSGAVAVSSYGEVQVYQSGIPAEFGDATSGVINITTRRPSAFFFNRVELISSQGLDAYGYNTLEILSSGPLKSMLLDSASGKTIPKVGYLIAGTVNYRKDGDPSPIGLLQVNDDVIDGIKANPLRPSPLGSGFVSQSEFLTSDDMTRVKVKPNTESFNYNLTGKVDWLINDNMMLTFGGRARRSSGNEFSFGRSLLNFENNTEFRNETYSGYIRLRQDFETSEDALLQNVGYTFQADYTHFENVRWDPNHQDDIFNYGHVGQFELYQQKYLWQTRQINAGTPDAFPLFALYEVETPFDTAVRFTPGVANPTSSNYTSQFFKFNDGDVNNLSQIQQNGGLINGTTPQALYSLWSDVGTPTTSYAKQSEDQVSINFSVNGSIKNHNLKFGIRYEERTLRYYAVSGASLWSTMRQSVNRHIKFQSNSLDSAIYVFTDGEYRGYELDQAQGSFLDTVRFPKTLNVGQQTGFDANFRKYLMENDYKDVYGNDINQYSFINPDAYDPSIFKLDWFNADDLLQNGTVAYYGYDHLGNKYTGLNDYLDNAENRYIAPYNPIYMAAYLQDEVVYENLNLRFGVRVDRFDANQQVLKDEFSLFPVKTVGELGSDGNLGEITVPGNIGNDYKVYVDDPYNPTKVVGYRNGDDWYLADGSETNDPGVIAQQSNTGTIAPYTSFSSRSEESEVGLTNDAFEDYKPQINVMPRVAVSFPISSTAMFFANYDVLTQRPQSRNIASIDAYYYLPARSTGTIGNPNLLPEKTISYEVGFQQALSEDMAIKVNAYYKELRDMIQIVPRRYAYPIDYTTYGNIDFGTVKGFIFSYRLRPSYEGGNKNVTLEANYTLQFANATGSGTTTQASLINAGQPNLRTLQPTNSDRRHNFVVSMDYRFQGGANYNGPVVGNGKKIFQNAGINLVGNALSGRPYSGQANVTQAVASGVAQRSTIDGSINGNRYPWLFNMNMRIDKSFQLKVGGDEEENSGFNSNVQVYIWVQNLFNTRNIVGLYRYTGLPDDDGWLASAEGQQATLGQTNQDSYQTLYEAKVQNPSNYTLPRLVRLGVVLNF